MWAYLNSLTAKGSHFFKILKCHLSLVNTISHSFHFLDGNTWLIVWNKCRLWIQVHLTQKLKVDKFGSKTFVPNLWLLNRSRFMGEVHIQQFWNILLKEHCKKCLFNPPPWDICGFLTPPPFLKCLDPPLCSAIFYPKLNVIVFGILFCFFLGGGRWGRGRLIRNLMLEMRRFHKLEL